MMIQTDKDLDLYLEHSSIIDFQTPAVAEQAAALAQGAKDSLEVARRCFEFVRDEIKHSWDYKQNPVTCRASQVLEHKTGFCYAKSHLLAALLRANGIPAGLCYQRLSFDDKGPPYSLHGLNAVYLEQFGWYRLDPRGNKAGIEALFTPPLERLAFTLKLPEEADFPEIRATPLPLVVEALEAYSDIHELAENLPDLEI